jgi:hypothetical protein
MSQSQGRSRNRIREQTDDAGIVLTAQKIGRVSVGVAGILPWFLTSKLNVVAEVVEPDDSGLPLAQSRRLTRLIVDI